MSELFSIQLQNRQQQGRDGVWLDLPTTTEQVQAALRQIGISSDNPQGLFISGYFAEEEKRFAIPYNMVLASNVDELNFLASRLETLSTGERAELNAALQAPQSELLSIGRITDFPENVEYYVHLPDVHGPAQLGDYYLNRSGMVDMPEEWKGGIDTAQFGRYVAQQEQGAFTQYGYLIKSGDEWQKVHEGQPVPEEYRVLSFPVPEVMRDAANIPPPVQPETEPQKVIPIILNGKDSAERMKEITDRLETGIQELFDSDRYKAYLTTMAKFHNYSFNNTLLIAMQGGQLVAGFNKWKDTFHRTVKKGEKGIKILAPAPYKVKQKMEKLDEQGKPILDKDGKPLTEEKTVQIPAFKVVSVFDVSQTEGEPLPSIAVNELSGSVQDYQDFFKALEQASPVPIGFEDIEGGAHGYFHLLDNRIAIQEGMSQLQTIKTAIHEIAHKITRKSFLKVLAATMVGGAAASALTGAAAPVSIDETNGKVSRWVKNNLNPDGPLTIAKQGMFSSGGTVTAPVAGTYDATTNWLDTTRAGNTAHVDHANVLYQIPADSNGWPMVYLHGYGQSRMGWITTPDGRQGWADLFLRNGYSAFLVDQPRRGEAGSTAQMSTDGFLDTWSADSKDYKPGDQAYRTYKK